MRTEILSILPSHAVDYVNAMSDRGDTAPAAAVGNRKREKSVSGAVAILPLSGLIVPRSGTFAEMFGIGISTETFGVWFDAAMADSDVGAIVLDVDSPGGSVFGVEELATKIMKARGQKPIIAVASPLMASGALWISAAADRLYVTPSGLIGSIGAIKIHVDQSKALEAEGLDVTFIVSSKFKAEGNTAEPLGDDARADIQEEVDRYHAVFVSQLAAGRGVSRAAVEKDFGQGRMLSPDDAVSVGMADGVRSMEQVLAELGAKRPTPRAGRQTSASVSVSNMRARLELRKRHKV